MEVRPLTDAEQHVVPDSTEPWGDSRALSIAIQNQDQMEQFQKTANHWTRWNTAEQLYLAWTQQKYWEGTKIPRASVPVYLVLEQVESLLPNVMSALFPLRDNVEVTPRPGTHPAEARAAFELLMMQLDSLGEDGMTRFREVARRAFKSAFIYGNGIVELCWLYRVMDVLRYYAIDVPLRDPMGIPTGEFRRILQNKKIQQYINQPDIKARSVRDFFIDPNTPSPNVQEARFCSFRDLMTVADLKNMRGQDGFKIPADSVLVDLAKEKPASYIDTQKQNVEVYRQGWWMPQNDYSANPDTWRVEVLRYYQKDRCVWVLNRNEVVYNQTNTYELLPALDAFYIDVPGRFYGLAISDILEGEQRTQQSIIAARLDELALNIHAPFKKKRGLSIAQSSMRVAPGKIIEVGDDPANDLVKMEWKPVTAEAYIEVDASEKRAQKVTGITDLVALGAPSQGGNSANRTATGINTQAAATGKRIQYLVENTETTFVETLLNIFHKWNQKFLTVDQVIELLGPDGQYLTLDPLHIKNADVKFNMRASDKLRSRMMLMQQLPMLFQFIFNPEVMQILAQQQGLTADMKEIMYLVCDTLQISPKQLFRPMTKQEMGMMQAPDQQQLAAKIQMQRERLQAQASSQEDKHDVDMAKAFMDKMITPEAAASIQNGMGMPEPLKLMQKKNEKHLQKPAKASKK